MLTITPVPRPDIDRTAANPGSLWPARPLA
jgi:hypothetical protein